MRNGTSRLRMNSTDYPFRLEKQAMTTLIIISVFCALCSQADAASTEEIPAEKLYEDAFRLIVEGNYAEAYDRLEEIIVKYPDSVYAQFAEDRKRRLEELNLPSIRRRKIDRSGRIESIVFGTLYTTWLGIGSARLANAESEKAIAAGMMMGAPAGLLASLALTRNARLSKGQSALINFSGYWGTWQGYGLAILLDGNDDEKTMIGSAMAGGMLGLLATSILTRKIDPSLGDASMINYGGIWGTWLLFCSAMMADVEDSDHLLGIALAGGNLGAAAMAALSPKVEVSLARATLINLGGVAGTIVAGGLLLLTLPENEKTVYATLMAGGILGLIGGCYATANFDIRTALQKSGYENLNRGMVNQTGRTNSREIQVDLLAIGF